MGMFSFIHCFSLVLKLISLSSNLSEVGRVLNISTDLQHQLCFERSRAGYDPGLIDPVTVGWPTEMEFCVIAASMLAEEFRQIAEGFVEVSVNL